MNKLLLTSLFFLSLSSSTRAQTSVYHPFPLSVTNAVWSILDSCYCGPWPPPVQTTHFYGLIGDTVIGSNSYIKVYNSHTDTFFNAATAYYVFALREENKKIYFWETWQSNEVLHYDFNLALGDSFPFDYAPLPGWRHVVAIDSELVDGSYRRALQFDGQERWIEGIGNEAGLNETTYFIGNIINLALCYSEYNSVLYHYRPSGTCYSGSVGIAEHNRVNTLSLFPNPAHDQFTVSVTGDLEIYNALGEKVYRQIVHRNSYIVHPNLPAGIYLVTVTDGAKLYRSKLIIN